MNIIDEDDYEIGSTVYGSLDCFQEPANAILLSKNILDNDDEFSNLIEGVINDNDGELESDDFGPVALSGTDDEGGACNDTAPFKSRIGRAGRKKNNSTRGVLERHGSECKMRNAAKRKGSKG